MRAGDYVELDGVTYPCVNPHGQTVRLHHEGSAAPPPGFDRDRWVRWTRLVRGEELTRLMTVHTVAVWRGRRVLIRRVFDTPAEALVEHRSWPPPDGKTVSVIDNGIRQTRVPIGALTEIVEEKPDVPVQSA